MDRRAANGWPLGHPAEGNQRPDSSLTSGAAPPGVGSQPIVTHMPGGSVLHDLRHPAFRPVSRIWSRLPTAAMYDPGVAPQRALTLTLGSYAVPQNQTLWIFDYRFGILRFSGLQPGVFVPADDGAFAGQIVFDITVNGNRRDGELHHELVPRPIELQDAARFTGSGGIPTAPGGIPSPATIQAIQAGSVNGVGLSALPDAAETYGPRGRAFTIEVKEREVVEMRFSLLQPLSAPIAGIRAQFSGYAIHTNTAAALVERLRPR